MIGGTSEEAVNINETTTESVEQTKPAKNADKIKKLSYTIMVSDISFFHFGCGESAVKL